MLYIEDPKTHKTLARWQIGQVWPLTLNTLNYPTPTISLPRVVIFQADGEELECLLKAIKFPLRRRCV